MCWEMLEVWGGDVCITAGAVGRAGSMELALQTELEGSLVPWAEFVHLGFGPVAVLWCEHSVWRVAGR